MRAVVLGGAGVVGLATATVSSVSLYQLAQACAIKGPLAAGLPVAVDAAGVVGAVSWVTQQGPARRWGQGIAVFALALTVAANGASHAISAGLLPVSLWLVLCVGATIPASLWATTHLSALVLASGPPRRSDRKASRSRTSPRVTDAPQPARSRRTPRDEPERAPSSAPPAPPQTPAATPITSATRLPDKIALWLLANRDAVDDTARIRAEFSCSEPTVKRARARFRVMRDERLAEIGAGR